jgi:hypothetical protein
MAIPLFLAMTGWEISKNEELPKNIAWMACHFSPYGTGLSNLPAALPPRSMVIVNDRTPVCGHDPERIVSQLAELVEIHQCSNILLDFQRPGEPETAIIAEAVVRELNCPVGVSPPYAEVLSCPVFLPPVPPHIPLGKYLTPWQERPVWLECALDGATITVTAEGSAVTPLPYPELENYRHRDTNLCCHYEIDITKKQAQFHLGCSHDDLHDLLAAAERINVTHAIGLFQELGAIVR